MKKTVFASVIMAAVLFGGAYILPAQAQDNVDPFKRIVSLKLENTDVRDALAQVAKNMGVPIDIAPDVQGTVTLSLSNVTNEVLLMNLTRQVDATMTMRQGRLVVHRSNPPFETSLQLHPWIAAPQPKITLQATKADVREALRGIFRQAKASYSIAPNVQGTVTTSLKDVPLHDALTSVLSQVNATFQMQQGIINIVHRDPRSIVIPSSNNWSDEPPIVTQDNKYLYLISSGKVVKIRKSDLKVEKEGAIPLQWGNQFRGRGFGGEF